jgi:hypothetical protein
MKLPVSDEAIDSAKKTVGIVLMLAAGLLETLAEFGVLDTRFGALTTCAAVAGAWLAGFGMLGARGKSARQLLMQAFGTDKPSEVQTEALAFAQKVASIAPPESTPADNSITWPKSAEPSEPRKSFEPPPPPRSKP